MEIEVAGAADADALAALFTASRRAAMPWLPPLHSAAENRRFIAEQVIGASDEVLLVRRDGLPVGFLALRGAMWVFQRNEGARAFYAKHGFTEVERTDGAANEEREPDVLLAWPGAAKDYPRP